MAASDDKNAQGILFMMISMAAFAVADTLVKVVSTTISPAQTLFFLVAGGLVSFAITAKIQGQSLIYRKPFTPILLLRYCTEVTGMFGMVLALALVPLSTVGAITQAAPMLVVFGAVVFLGEKVSWRRWSSIGVGFIGVLLIVQPGGANFDYSVLWAVLAMTAMAIRDLITRLTPPEMGSSTLATYTMLAATPFATGWVLYNGESLFPAHADWLNVSLMVVLGSLAYLLLIASIRMAEVSVVTPFRYSRIIFLLVLGVVIFDERPGVNVILGATLVIASGVYIMWREQQVKRRKNAS